MPHAPGHLSPAANLGESLAAEIQCMLEDTRKQNSALYFDYIGLTMFPRADVQVLASLIHDMLARGLREALQGHGSLFLTVHAWPLSTDRAHITARLAYTVRSGARDLGTLSTMFKRTHASAAAQCRDMPSMAQAESPLTFSEGVNAECVEYSSPKEGAVIELRLSLPHAGAELEPVCLTELSTVSAWLIGALPDEAALLATRLQRDGWLVRQFADIREALDFWSASKGRLEPALVVAIEQDSDQDVDLNKARAVWSSQCRIIYGIHTQRPASGVVDRPGIEIRTIPFSPTDLREIKELASQLEATRKEVSRLQKRDVSRLRPTALVVDDGPVNRVLATEMLHVLGYDCDTANNGQEAVEYVERYRPDVILMDLEMPIMDGMEATERIRRYEMHGIGQYTPIPIIATTAVDEQDVSTSWEAIGMTAFVPKPLMMDRLAKALATNHSRH